MKTLTKQEWIIMEDLWANNPTFLSDMMLRLEGRLPWKRGTYQTYLRRMLDKEYISYVNIRGSRSYSPILQREDCIRRESEELMSVLKGDSTKMMLSFMIEKSGLDSADSQELKNLIDKLAAENEGGE